MHQCEETLTTDRHVGCSTQETALKSIGAFIRQTFRKNEPFVRPFLTRYSSADDSKTKPADDDHEEEKEEENERASSKRQPAPAILRPQLAAAGAGDKRVKYPKQNQASPRSSPRPFQQALQALNRLTAAAGKPHDGVATAVSSFSSRSPGITCCERVGRELGHTNRAHGSSRGRRGSLGGGEGGGARSSFSAGERFRVGFDIIRLLTGPDGNDGSGRPTGVRPGEDVKAAVLSGGRSQVCAHFVRVEGSIAVARREYVVEEELLSAHNLGLALGVCSSAG